MRIENLSKLFIAAGVSALGLALTACPPSGVQPPAEGAVPVEFYVMSQCPYGVQVENAIGPVLKDFGRMIDFKLDFIGNTLPDGSFKSLHGEPEVKGNIAQLCAIKHSPGQYFEMINCMNKNARAIPGNWEECASSSGVNVGAVKSCFEGEEGKTLLKESFDRAQKAGARGSPTIKINGKPYNGGRSTQAFTRAICDEFAADKKPAVCGNLPPPVEVNLTVLNDKRCQDCGFRASRFLQRLKMDMPGLKVTELDYADEAGKKLYTDKNLGPLPAFVFDSKIEQVEEARRYVFRMKKQGDDRILELGEFDPKSEICDNKVDDTGDGKIDCDDATCKATLECRAENKGQLEVFVMSQCPYGVRALNSVKEVIDTFKDKMKFQVNFIADETEPGKFKALHGQGEVDENIRELCAVKYYGKNYKFMDYILCRNKDIRSNEWQKCATKETGIDAAVIKKCAEGPEGIKLHSENIKIAKGLKIGASPTWIANGKYKFSGVAANDIKSNWCRYNPGTAGCDKEMSKDQAVQGSCN